MNFESFQEYKQQIVSLSVRYSFQLLLITSVLWGITNPLLRQGSIAVEKSAKKRGFFKQIVAYLLSWRIYGPLILNQLGSVFYLLSLLGSNLKQAVPITNSLTFVISSVSDSFLDEKKKLKRKQVVGIVLVVVGISICAISDELDF